jgi:Ni/Co efflux regulator RcnB
MKRAALIGTLVVSLATGSAALADSGGRGDYRHHGRTEHARVEHGRSLERHDFRGDHRDFRPDRRDFRADRRDFRGDRRDFRGPSLHYYEHRAPARYGFYSRPHGYYSHRWVRGERLPVAFYGRPYVIADYRDCGLRVPPRGYHWVRVDGDAVLAAVATGIVLDTVFHVFN